MFQEFTQSAETCILTACGVASKDASTGAERQVCVSVFALSQPRADHSPCNTASKNKPFKTQLAPSSQISAICHSEIRMERKTPRAPMDSSRWSNTAGG